MAKDIRVKVSLPTSQELQGQLNNLTSKLQNNKLDLKLNINTDSLKSFDSGISELQKKLKSMGEVKILSQGNSSVDGRIISEFVTIEDKLGNITKLTEKNGQVFENLLVPIEKITQAEKKFEESIYKSNDALDVKKMKLQQTLDQLYKNGNISETKLDTSGLNNAISGINLGTSGVEIEKIKQQLSQMVALEKEIVNVKKQQQQSTANEIAEQLKLKDSVEATKVKYQAQLDVIQKQNQAFLNSSKGSGLKNELEGVSKKLNNLNPKTMNELNSYTNKLDATLKTTKADISAMGKEWSLSTKSTNTFTSAISEATKKVGIFSLSYMAINQIRTSIREGIEAVKEMDSAMSTLKITMDGMTSSGLQSMTKQSQELATSLSGTTTEVLKIVKVFANSNETIQSIMDKSKGATILSNLSGIDSSETAKTILAATNQFSDFADGTEEDIMRIADSITAVSRSLKLDFSEGVAGAGEGIKILGSLSDQVGMSLEETLALLSSTVEKTQMSYSEVATAQKTIMSRIFRQGDVSGEEALKAEKALNAVGVAIKDAEGNMVDYMDIMQQLNGKWGTFSDVQKQYIGDALGGARQLNIVLAGVQNMARTNELTELAMNSAGEAMKANEIYAQSLDGKLTALTNTTQIFWQNFFNSDMLKGSIDGLNGFIRILDGMQNTFGTTGVSVGLLTTAFLTFTNNPLKSFSTGVIKGGEDTTNFQKTLTSMWTTMKESNGITAKASAGVKGLGSAFNSAGIQAMATRAKIIALNTVLSAVAGIGIGLAIGAITTAVSKLADAAIVTKEEFNDMIDVFNSDTSDYNKLTELAEKQKTLNEEIKSGTLRADEQKTKKEELITVQNELAKLLPNVSGQFDAEGNAIKLDTDEIQANIDAKKEMLAMESVDIADKGSRRGEWIGLVTSYEDQLKKVKELQESYNNNPTLEGLEKLTDEKSKLDDYNKSISNLSSIIKNLKEQNIGDLEIANMLFGNAVTTGDRSERVLEYLGVAKDMVDEYTLSVNNNTKAKEENNNVNPDNDTTKAQSQVSSLESTYKSLGYSVKDASDRIKELNELSTDDRNAEMIKDATKAYGQAISSTKELQGYIDDINESAGLTPEIIMSLASAYPELGSRITDVSAVQQFLNDKISESVVAQQTAYTQMVANDQTYYASKVSTDDALRESIRNMCAGFVDENGNAYDVDLKNYSTLSELKADLTNALGEEAATFITNMITANAEGYDVDLDKQKLSLISVMV